MCGITSDIMHCLDLVDTCKYMDDCKKDRRNIYIIRKYKSFLRKLVRI